MKNLIIIILFAFIIVSCNSKKDETKIADNKAAEEIAFQKELEKTVK